MTPEQRTDARHWTSEQFREDRVAQRLAAKLLPFAMDALEQSGEREALRRGSDADPAGLRAALQRISTLTHSRDGWSHGLDTEFLGWRKAMEDVQVIVDAALSATAAPPTGKWSTSPPLPRPESMEWLLLNDPQIRSAYEFGRRSMEEPCGMPAEERAAFEAWQAARGAGTPPPTDQQIAELAAKTAVDIGFLLPSETAPEIKAHVTRESAEIIRSLVYGLGAGTPGVATAPGPEPQATMRLAHVALARSRRWLVAYRNEKHIPDVIRECDEAIEELRSHLPPAEDYSDLRIVQSAGKAAMTGGADQGEEGGS